MREDLDELTKGTAWAMMGRRRAIAVIGWLALGACRVGAADLPAGVEVYCGSFTPFVVRTNVGPFTAEQRASAAIDLINKYLGGRIGKVATVPAGKNTKVTLNGELVVLVTPQDAEIEKLKTSAELATKWAKKLSVAFEASKAQK